MITRLRSTSPVRLFGLGLFVGMMTVGYYYNLTFVQLGLVEMGEHTLGMSETAVASQMALLALVTCLTALAFGIWMSRRVPGLAFKLRVAFLTVLIQTGLTFLAGRISRPSEFTAWIVVCALTLGMAVPATFGLSVDLVPVRWRGRAAALITASAYLAANLVPASWTLADFAAPLLWVMPAGVLGLGVLAFSPLSFLGGLARQQEQPAFAQGRYARSAGARLTVLILLMFAVFFVDSLGFLRLIEVPRFMLGAWQSGDVGPRLFIGLTHAVVAMIGGVLYDALDVRALFYWIFGIFALTHLMYTLSLRIATAGAPLVMPMLYATAVSLYTVVNFALWADLSTPRTIGRNVALGVAVSGWTATFISTALAIWWRTDGLSLERHLNIVDALAMLFLLVLLLEAFLPSSRAGSTGPTA